MFRVLKKGLLVDRKLLVRYIVNYKAQSYNRLEIEQNIIYCFNLTKNTKGPNLLEK